MDDEVAVEVDDVVIADPCAVALRVSSSTFRSRVSACALTRLNRALRSARVQILATVHDEAVLLVPDDVESVERIGAIAQQEMIAAFLEVFPDVPTLNLVDPKVGPTWGICRHCRTGCKVTILTRLPAHFACDLLLEHGYGR